MRNISPTNIKFKLLRFEDGSTAVTMLCNTCGWYRGTRSVTEARQIAVDHIENWHGSGTLEYRTFRQEVERNKHG